MQLTPSMVLYGYEQGIFPMADPHDGAVYWYRPHRRGVIPLEGFHVPKNLRKLVRRRVFNVVTDRAFEQVMRACADRESTWISDELIDIYTVLHRMGYAHSVECWREDRLVGGLYGVVLGGAFFGESMFHRESNASKVALVHLVRRLREGGFVLLDTQYTTPHLNQFGAIEISATAYEERLRAALSVQARWPED